MGLLEWPAHEKQSAEMEAEIGTDPGIALLHEFEVPAGKGQTASFPVPGVTIGLTVMNGTAARMGVDISSTATGEVAMPSHVGWMRWLARPAHVVNILPSQRRAALRLRGAVSITRRPKTEGIDRAALKPLE